MLRKLINLMVILSFFFLISCNNHKKQLSESNIKETQLKANQKNKEFKNKEKQDGTPEIVKQMQKVIAGKNLDLAGEIFGTSVPMNNYYFTKKAVITFGAKWRGTPQTNEELEDLVWQELVFSYEAFNRGLTVTDKEVEEETEKILKAQKVEFDWKSDNDQFDQWCQDTLSLNPEGLKNQMIHLIKLEKLRQEVIDSFEPEVSDDEAYQKFLNEYNTLSVELRRFDDKKQADALYEKVKNPIARNAIQKLIWGDLILSFQALKRGITADSEETDRVMKKLMREKKARFKWKEDVQEFEAWVKDNMGMESGEFLKIMVSITTIDLLVQKIFSDQEVAIDLDGEFTEFLKKNRTIKKAYKNFFKAYAKDSSILRFSDLETAKEFYKKINRMPGPWEDRRRREPKEFKQPGFVALDFLINMWKFQKDDCYKMLEMKAGEFYPASPIYKGYAVFKILDIRRADLDKFKEREQYYFDRVKNIKKYEAYKQWREDFNKEANIEVYITDQES